jgi:hypothetical protein
MQHLAKSPLLANAIGRKNMPKSIAQRIIVSDRQTKKLREVKPGPFTIRQHPYMEVTTERGAPKTAGDYGAVPVQDH